MLKHEDSPQTQSQSAAEVRVTPEELAAAITRLEARKDASQRSLDGTIAIGEVVQQLGLDATPEEILTEVQAGRNKTEFQGKRLSPKQRLKVLVAAGIAMVGLITWNMSSYYAGSPSSPANDTQSAPITSYYIPAATSSTIHISYAPNLLVSDASNKLMLLSEVGDNQPVTCVLNGGSLQQTSSLDPNRWTLIKHEGKVYLRGWMARMSPMALQEDGADVSAIENSVSVPVTVPVSGFKFSTTPQNAPYEFHASDIHLDKHAYEKW